MIDRHELLATLKPLLTQLEASIRERALATQEVAAHLEQEHDKAIAAERTAMSLEEWRDGEITQAAVAWVLGCVFVRFLEDNGLIDQALISGPGGRRAAALGYREEYFRHHPDHSDREYLEGCFRAAAAFPAVEALYDERHNPLWRLAPTADGASALRETLSAINPDSGTLVHDFSDASLDTRFLGDLYQDLSDQARERFALLQTPDFVERFILDRTLTPAINEFGLAAVRLIDPTCGSGHFLIGAFERLFAEWREREPGTEIAVLAQRSLDQVAGVDLNPFATAIARFRLVIAALRAAGIGRLAEAPAFRLHLATGDSLLHGPLPDEGATALFDAGRLTQNIAHVYESEDAAALSEILGRGYHAVVGNPPYIRGHDEAARAAYRSRYGSCHRHFVLTVPFMERFFELAMLPAEGGLTRRGYIGKITANSFMKRDFGRPLVEKFLPSQNLAVVVDCSGADIPGHSGIPTVVLFGRPGRASTSTVTVARSLQGESSATGRVFWDELDRELTTRCGDSALVAVEERPRDELARWPWSLSGDTGTLVERLARSCKQTVAEVLRDVGRITHTGDDPSFLVRLTADQTWSLPFVRGDDLRDWVLTPEIGVLFPYHHESGKPVDALPRPLERMLWPRRASLRLRKDFGQSPEERGLNWFEYSMFFPERYLDAAAVGFAYMAHVNNAVPLSYPAVTTRPAPVLRFKAGVEVNGIVGILNSSAATAYVHARCQPKPGFTELWTARYEVSNADLKSIPLPDERNATLADLLVNAGREVATTFDRLKDADALRSTLAQLEVADRRCYEQMISLQEELDWQVLVAYGFAPRDLVLGDQAPGISVGQRAFEIALARRVAAGELETMWFEKYRAEPTPELPTLWPAEYREVVERRIELIESDPNVSLIERPEHKRRWDRTPWEARQRAALASLVLDALDTSDLWSDMRPRSTAELTDYLRHTPRLTEAMELLGEKRDADLSVTLQRLVLDEAVPHLAAQRYTDSGLLKRAVWERVWDLQRAEDRRGDVGRINGPPRYVATDFRSGIFWKLRGKLDVAKERFVLLPNAERGADTSSVVGWAGWDERDLARAIAGRVTELRDQEAADARRLTSLLAGVLELLPWIQQWYPDSDPAYGGTPGQYFEGWLDGQLAELSITRDNLRAWRPPAPTRGRKAKAGAA